MSAFFQGVDNFLHSMGGYFNKTVESYVSLEAAPFEKSFVSKDMSYSTVIAVKGLLRMTGDEDFLRIIETLNNAIAPYLKSPGHRLQIVMRTDPLSAKSSISRSVDAVRKTAENLEVDLDVILDEYGERVSEYCSDEEVYFTLWTMPVILNKSERKDAFVDMNARLDKGGVKAADSQKDQRFLEGMINKHESFVSSIEATLRDNEMVYETLDCKQALRAVRRHIDPEFTDHYWEPILTGGEVPFFEREDYQAEDDFSNFYYPRIANQVFPRDPYEVDSKIVEIGNRIFYPLQVLIPSRSPMIFNALFRKLTASRMPMQISFMLEGGGISGHGLKQFLSGLANFGKNKLYTKAIKLMRERENNGASIVGYRTTIMTWEEGSRHDVEAIRRLKRRGSELASMVQSWGNADLGEIGDPMLGVVGCLPVISNKSPSPSALAPLDEALFTLPLTRPAKVWSEGSYLMRSRDGKFMPYMPGSSKQTAWIDIGVAPMGYGKSVSLNTTNLAFLLQPGLARLPYLSMVDVGPSSSGIVSLFKKSLPADQKHLAVYHRMRMVDEHAVNPCDTPLGGRYPTPNHKNFLINFLSLLATPLNKEEPEDGVTGISEMVIMQGYREFSDERNPKPYKQNVIKDIDELLKDLGVDIDEPMSWWEVVDFLFEQGRTYEASVAQRYAVPTVPELANLAKNSSVTQSYTHTTPGGEIITDYYWRLIMESVRMYPILRIPTQFDLSEAKIVSVDLDEVAPKGGAAADRQTGVMYMIARHLVAAKFFVMPQDVASFPELYIAHHKRRIKELREDPKRLAYDECHRFIRNSAIAKQIVGDLETAIRESRKWNLHIGLYSQAITDFPDIIVELASTVYIMGYGSEKMIEEIVSRFSLNNIEKESLKSIGKPGKSGANMLVRHRIGDGVFCQLMTSTIGAKMIWAFSSTTEDTSVRNGLYDRIGIEGALTVLAAFYPGGSIKEEVERRREYYATEGLKVDVISEFIEELIAHYSKERF